MPEEAGGAGRWLPGQLGRAHSAPPAAAAKSYLDPLPPLLERACKRSERVEGEEEKEGQGGIEKGSASVGGVADCVNQ